MPGKRVSLQDRLLHDKGETRGIDAFFEPHPAPAPAPATEETARQEEPQDGAGLSRHEHSNGNLQERLQEITSALRHAIGRLQDIVDRIGAPQAESAATRSLSPAGNTRPVGKTAGPPAVSALELATQLRHIIQQLEQAQPDTGHSSDRAEETTR